MTAYNEREYNIYLCPKCKHFASEHRPPRMGWCAERKGAPIPVISGGAEPLLKSDPCGRYVFGGKK